MAKTSPKNDLRGAVLDIIMRLFGQQNTLTVSVPLIDATGSIESALFLSQLIYWSDRSTIAGGWIAKTYAEWYEELRLTKRQVSRISKRLQAAGVETKVAKFAGLTPVHYRIDRDTFYKWFEARLIEAGSDKTALPEVTKCDFQKLQNVTSSSDEMSLLDVTKRAIPLTETTAETTQRLHTDARERDVLFDAIALHIFSIEGSVPKSSGGRIAKVKKALTEIENGEVPSAAARVAEFARWYKSYHPGMATPRDAGKLSEYYLAYKKWADERDEKAAPVVAPAASDAFEVPPIFADLDLSEPTSPEDQQAKVQAVIDRIAAKWSQN